MSVSTRDRTITQAIDCKNHRGRAATSKCSACNNAFCDSCMQPSATTQAAPGACPSCKGYCRSLVAPGPRKPQSFAAILADALTYPLRGKGLAFLVGGVIYFGILKFLAASVLVFFFGVLAGGYLAAAVFKILNSSAAGESELPSWPEFANFIDTILLPFWQMTVVIFACFLPAAMAIVFAGANPTGYVLCTLLGLAGCFYFPMALMAAALHNSVTAITPRVVFGGIGAIAGVYPFACVTMAAIYGVVIFCQMVVAPAVPYLGAALSGFASLFLLSVEMRILGLLYYSHEDHFPWLK